MWRTVVSNVLRLVTTSGCVTDTEKETTQIIVALCCCVVSVCFRREGEGVRVFWDRLREPSFTSRWNPFTTDYPFATFTHHPVSNVSESFAALCDVRTLVIAKSLTLTGRKKKSTFLSSELSDGDFRLLFQTLAGFCE